MSQSDQPKHVRRAQNPKAQSPQAPDEAIHPSRRQVMAGAGVGLGLVATGALAGAAGSALASGDSAVDEAHGSGEPVVAHVRDVSTGDIDVYFGDRQVRIRDRVVAARLSSVTR